MRALARDWPATSRFAQGVQLLGNKAVGQVPLTAGL